MIYDNEDAISSSSTKDVNTVEDLREITIKFPLEDSDEKFISLMKEFDSVKYIPYNDVQGFLIFYKTDLSNYKTTTCSKCSAKILQSIWKNGCFEILGEK